MKSESVLLIMFPFLVWCDLQWQIKPGLSAYADSPRNAADSLIGLLDKAQNAVPKKLRASTPVRVGVGIY